MPGRARSTNVQDYYRRRDEVIQSHHAVGCNVYNTQLHYGLLSHANRMHGGIDFGRIRFYRRVGGARHHSNNDMDGNVGDEMDVTPASKIALHSRTPRLIAMPSVTDEALARQCRSLHMRCKRSSVAKSCESVSGI